MNKGNKFYRWFLLMFLINSILQVIVFQVKPSLLHVPGICFTQIFFLLVVPLGHFVAEKGLKDKARDFHIYYMGSMGLRFLLSVIFLFLIVFFYSEGAWQIVINFFLLYFLYTSFEIYSLLANLRAENKKE